MLPTDDCIEWPRARSKAGYGQVWLNGKVQYVHRLAFEEWNQEPPKAEVRHTCDNPPCLNPAHLAEGTHRENMHDMLKRQRQPATKLSWEKVAEIRNRYRLGGVSQRALAREYGVSQRLVLRVLQGTSWPEEAAQ